MANVTAINVTAINVEVSITIGGRRCACWRLRALGWCAWLLRVPCQVAVTEE